MRKLTTDQIIIATLNHGKLREFQRLFAGYPVELLSLAELGLEAADETAKDFHGNARLKAVAASIFGRPAVADDSGLCVDALGGQPGVDSADWAKGADGRDYDAAMARIWQDINALRTPPPHRAGFRCAICVAWPDGHIEQFEGNIRGHLVWPPRGNGGFGYDAMFVPDGDTRTFAEMPDADKSRLSHRAAAAASFVAGCLDPS